MKFKHFFMVFIALFFIAIECQAATLDSDLMTNRNASPVVNNNPNVDGGTVRRIRSSYTFTGSEASADVIQMAQIPKGSVILREQSTIKWGNMGGTVTAEVGDVFDPDRYCSSIAMGESSIFRNLGTDTNFTEALGANGTYTSVAVGTSTSDDTVDVTLTTVTNGATGAVMYMEVVYVSSG